VKLLQKQCKKKLLLLSENKKALGEFVIFSESLISVVIYRCSGLRLQA
jgi:hypothetical protein